MFGWVISGKMLECAQTQMQSFHVNLDEQLQRFWELEEIPQKKHWTAEEMACEKHSVKYTEVVNTRFLVSLPFKDSSALGNSKEQALKRFRYLERRLEAKPDLQKRYSQFIRERVEMNHMEELTDDNILDRPIMLIEPAFGATVKVIDQNNMKSQKMLFIGCLPNDPFAFTPSFIAEIACNWVLAARRYSIGSLIKSLVIFAVSS